MTFILSSAAIVGEYAVVFIVHSYADFFYHYLLTLIL